MAKKKVMGRNLGALLGGASRARGSDADTAANESGVTASNDKAVAQDTEHNADPTPATKAAPVANPSEAAPLKTPSGAAETSSSHAQQGGLAAVDLTESSQAGDRLRVLGVDQVRRGEYQPRRHFDKTLLQELADSLGSQGMIQPILVRPSGDAFEIIAGERRWRAAQLAGITEIPAIVRELDDQRVAAVSLIENIQRADLNPLEEAQALERLCEEFSMTHQSVAEAVGRSRASVSNLIRLLELHDDVKQLVDRNDIDMGHARALLGAPTDDQPTIARRIVKQGLTVRAVEKLVRNMREGKPLPAAREAATDPNIEALRRKLSEILGTPVAIKHQKSGSGKLEIPYTSIDELEGILSHIK